MGLDGAVPGMGADTGRSGQPHPARGVDRRRLPRTLRRYRRATRRVGRRARGQTPERFVMGGRHLTPPPMPGSGGTPELHGRGHMSHVDTILAWALWWVRICGLWLFPAEIGGKRPVVPHGFKSASRDPARIASWWAGRYAGYNLAART